jgi:hypothetical protein
MIVGKQVIKAKALYGQPDGPNSRRIPAKLGLWVYDANLHPWSIAEASVVAATGRSEGKG